jgi:hypothetical protein
MGEDTLPPLKLSGAIRRSRPDVADALPADELVAIDVARFEVGRGVDAAVQGCIDALEGRDGDPEAVEESFSELAEVLWNSIHQLQLAQEATHKLLRALDGTEAARR